MKENKPHHDLHRLVLVWEWSSTPFYAVLCLRSEEFLITLLAVDQLSGSQGLPTSCIVVFSNTKCKTRSLLMFRKWTNTSMWNLTQNQTLNGAQQYVNHCFHVVCRLKTADSNLNNWWSSSLPLSAKKTVCPGTWILVKWLAGAHT